jgi:hypothetical protein
VFGEVPGEWLSRQDADELALWAWRNETQAQTIFEYLVQTGMADAGAADVSPLPAMQPEDLRNILFGERSDAFVAQPVWEGLPRETTPLGRQADHPLIESVSERYGPGLLALAHARQLAGIRNGCERRRLAPCRGTQVRSPARDSARGGFAEAARGTCPR